MGLLAMPNIIDAENLFSEISKVFASYYQGEGDFYTLIDNLNDILTEEDSNLELMEYAHNGDNNPDQKEVDVIFEEACNDLKGRCESS